MYAKKLIQLFFNLTCCAIFDIMLSNVNKTKK